MISGYTSDTNPAYSGTSNHTRTLDLLNTIITDNHSVSKHPSRNDYLSLKPIISVELRIAMAHYLNPLWLLPKSKCMAN